jgi:hypothetical protein
MQFWTIREGQLLLWETVGNSLTDIVEGEKVIVATFDVPSDVTPMQHLHHLADKGIGPAEYKTGTELMQFEVR